MAFKPISVDLTAVTADPGATQPMSRGARRIIADAELTPEAPEVPPSRDAECALLGRHIARCKCTGTMRGPI